MIEQIRITNFQIHKDLTINLGRSTVLQGDSNHGKTAVLRALYWVANNEPSGDSYVSYWAKDGNKFKDGMYTEVEVRVDGHTIVRRRDNKFNGYVVDGVKYEALRGGVPDVVTNLLNLSPVSTQRQLDAPFLLSMTPGEAASFLNSLANLEDVSGILATAKRSSTDAAAAAEAAAQEVEAAEKLVHTFDWVPEVQQITEACERTAISIKQAQDERAIYEQSRIDFDNNAHELHPLERALQALPDPVHNDAAIAACREGVQTLRDYRDALVADEAASRALKELATLGDYPQAVETHRDQLERSLVEYDGLEDVDALRQAEEALDKLGPCVTVVQTPRRRMEQTLAEYDALEDVAAIDAEIEALEHSLEGLVCPTCGRPYALH